MVHRKSEYQNEFKPSIIKSHQPTYLENLTFRNNRREREFLHTPICWDVDGEEEELSDSNVNCNTNTKTIESEEPQYQSLAEILAESSKKNQVFRQNKQKSVGDLDIGKISLECDENINSVSNDKLCASKSVEKVLEINDDTNEKPLEICTSSEQKIFDSHHRIDDNKDPGKLMDNENKAKMPDLRKKKFSKDSSSHTQSKSTGCKLTKGTGKPKRPDRQGIIPGSSQSRKSGDYSSFDKPPFLSYGAGDKEPNLAIHRTHNVRSCADVYAQALKAQRLREAGKRRKQKEKQRAIESANALLERLATATPRDHQSWQSEYRKQFHGYEPKEYERAMSSRAVISHATPINAVHRGGCLIVHVD